MKKKLYSLLMCLVLIAASNLNASTDEVAETLSRSWWQSLQTAAGSVWDSGSDLAASAVSTVKPAWNATGLDTAWDTVCSGVSTVCYDDPYYAREMILGVGTLLTGAYVARRILTSRDDHQKANAETSSDECIARVLAQDEINGLIQKLEAKMKTATGESVTDLADKIANLKAQLACL